MEPLVSILVPCYNHSDYVVECLNSIRNQSYRNIELLIEDDGSVDNSFEIIKEWMSVNSSFFSNVYFKSTRNKGVVQTLKSLLEKSSGEYIAFCASDDVLTPDSILFRVNCFVKNPSVGMVFGVAKVIDNLGHCYADDAARDIFGANVSNFSRNILIDELFFRWSMPGPVSMFRKDALSLIGGVDEKYLVEDRSIFLRLVCNSIGIKYVPVDVAYYRRHQFAYTVNNDSKRKVQLDIAVCHSESADCFDGVRKIYLKSFCFDRFILSGKVNKFYLSLYFLVKAGRKIFFNLYLRFH